MGPVLLEEMFCYIHGSYHEIGLGLIGTYIETGLNKGRVLLQEQDQLVKGSIMQMELGIIRVLKCKYDLVGQGSFYASWTEHFKGPI